jgi:hypothetical protein
MTPSLFWISADWHVGLAIVCRLSKTGKVWIQIAWPFYKMDDGWDNARCVFTT